MSNEDIIANLTKKLEQAEADKAALVAVIGPLLDGAVSNIAISNARKVLGKYSHE